MIRTNLWGYLWDLVDEGVDEAFDQIQGNLGASGISLATTYHSVVQLRPHAEVRPRLFHSRGGLWFQPDRSHYAEAGFDPVVASWLGTNNPLADIAETSRKRQLALHGWTICCHQGVTVAAHPELACRNVFGDVDPTWLCPAQPRVQAYLSGLVSDLSQNYAVDVIELESPHWPAARHFHEHEKIGPALPEAAAALLALCFCDACRASAARADVDVSAVEVRVSELLTTFFRTERLEAGSLDALADVDSDLSAYFEWRFDATAGLMAKLKKAARCRLLAYGGTRSIEAGYDPSRILEHVDALMGIAYGPEKDAVDAAAKALDSTLRDRPNDRSIGLNATHSSSPTAQVLVQNLTRAAELGFTQANIYNYGLLTDERLNWVRQAIRSARRAGPS